MSECETSLHVSQIGENGEVESDSGALGQAGRKPEAEELAAALAGELGARSIESHIADGQVEKHIHLQPRADEPAS